MQQCDSARVLCCLMLCGVRTDRQPGAEHVPQELLEYCSSSGGITTHTRSTAGVSSPTTIDHTLSVPQSTANKSRPIPFHLLPAASAVAPCADTTQNCYSRKRRSRTHGHRNETRYILCVHYLPISPHHLTTQKEVCKDEKVAVDNDKVNK